MMDKAKKNILIKNRVGLVENINIEDGLLTQIASQQILTQRTIKSIEVKDILRENFRQTQSYCTSLQKHEQLKIVKIHHYFFFTGQKDII